MSGLPTQIPPQSEAIGKVDNSPITIDLNWYLWFYNLSVKVFGTGGGSGSTPSSPFDALDAANLFAQTADIPQAYQHITNLAALIGSNTLLPDPEPAAQPVQAVTVGASPFTYTALANGLLSVTGGAVSSASIIRQGVSVATGITSSSSIAVAGHTDEKGSGGQPGFVAGVDFTSGVSTVLTLSKNYGSADNLWVAFDAGEQGANSYTLGGVNNETLTFNAPIIAGTVFVKGALPSTISSSGGLIPLRRLDKVQITYTSAPTVAFLPA